MKIVICPLFSIIFFQHQKFSAKQKGSFTKLFFSVLWDKKFRQNRDAPLLCMKEFDKRIFLKHQSVLQWNILVQWDKNFSTENRDPSPLIHKFFLHKIPTRNVLKHRMVPWRSFFGPVRKKIATKPWSFPPPSLENFRYQNSFETQKCSPKNFIGTVRKKNFNGVYWYPLLMHKILRSTKLSESPKCSPTKFFGTVWQKVFDGETWYPPLWCIKVFDTRNFLIQRSVPQRNFLVLCDKKFSTEKRDTPLFCIKYRNQWWNWCL